jgi:hypothetical protein
VVQQLLHVGGLKPGTCSVPVSRQFHSLEPPGKSLASL